MILNSRIVKLASLDTFLELTVSGSTPTSATISWLKDTEKPELGTDEKTVVVTDSGDGVFAMTFFVPAAKYWLKLNTESRKMLFENDFKANTVGDRILAHTGNTSSFELYVPVCDLAELNIEVFTVDGEQLDAFGESAKFWYTMELLIFDGYGSPKLCYKLAIFNMWLRSADGAWRFQDTYSSFNVKVTNVRNIIQNEVLRATIVDDADYLVEYLDKEKKVQTRTANWVATISS
jgi:hypothetical protein